MLPYLRNQLQRLKNLTILITKEVSKKAEFVCPYSTRMGCMVGWGYPTTPLRPLRRSGFRAGLPRGPVAAPG